MAPPVRSSSSDLGGHAMPSKECTSARGAQIKPVRGDRPAVAYGLSTDFQDSTDIPSDLPSRVVFVARLRTLCSPSGHGGPSDGPGLGGRPAGRSPWLFAIFPAGDHYVPGLGAPPAHGSPRGELFDAARLPSLVIGFITRGVEDRRTNVGLFEAFELEAAQRCHIKIASSDIREPQTFGRPCPPFRRQWPGATGS